MSRTDRWTLADIAAHYAQHPELRNADPTTMPQREAPQEGRQQAQEAHPPRGQGMTLERSWGILRAARGSL